MTDLTHPKWCVQVFVSAPRTAVCCTSLVGTKMCGIDTKSVYQRVDFTQLDSNDLVIPAVLPRIKFNAWTQYQSICSLCIGTHFHLYVSSLAEYQIVFRDSYSTIRRDQRKTRTPKQYMYPTVTPDHALELRTQSTPAQLASK